MENLKIGFFGTPEIASYCLQKLISQYNVVFAVTQEDKPQGRSKSLVKSPVKITAEENNIPVFQPSSIKEEAFIEQLRSFNADIFVVVAYGKIIPSSIFLMPRLKTVNLHPSMLPEYRGAAPVESAIRDGVKISGITVQYINEKLDAGDIVLQIPLPIPENYTSGDLFEDILPKGADLLSHALEGLASGTLQPVKQIEQNATYCGKFNKDSSLIDWNNDALKIHNQIRAFNPKPVAWTHLRSSVLRIWNSIIPLDCSMVLAAGEIAVYMKKRLMVGTGNGILELISVQPEGKKVMTADAFINGYKPASGERFS